MSTINVISRWDAEAEVWVATSPEIPGLILEAETSEGIVEEAQRMVPELLQLRPNSPRLGTSRLPVVKCAFRH